MISLGFREAESENSPAEGHWRVRSSTFRKKASGLFCIFASFYFFYARGGEAFFAYPKSIKTLVFIVTFRRLLKNAGPHVNGRPLRTSNCGSHLVRILLKIGSWLENGAHRPPKPLFLSSQMRPDASKPLFLSIQNPQMALILKKYPYSRPLLGAN